MLAALRSSFKYVPTLVLAMVLAVAVWILAVTESDPTEEKIYPRAIPLEIIGQDPALMMVTNPPQQVSLTLSAPRSIWERMTNEQVPVRAVADLSGLGSGTHTLSIQIQIGIRPVEIISYTPRTFNVTLEPLETRSLPIRLVQRGELSVGFQGETPNLSQDMVTVSGPESLVKRVQEVRAVLDLNGAKESINRSVALQAVDASGQTVEDVTLSPERVTIALTITQRGGYRNVVVKVVVNGQVTSGYRVTNISVFPPAVTVFSSDPKLVDALPGYVETTPLDLTGASDDLDLSLPLNLPAGVSVVGENQVEVQVGIAAIEGSLTLANMPVEVVGLSNSLSALVSPDTVDVILSGPLPLLDQLRRADVRVFVDLTGDGLGTFQRIPKVELQISNLRVESLLPATLEVVITTRQPGQVPTITRTPTPAISVTLTPQP